ncbi:cytoskeletal protein CcmA (bactofilin family) [Ruminiclostridium sufflavum DSM 19573]|uniref:Cytoskeletal protein CcmA (Bactofilin family) n=1 Tax=Ruminiclostridium sufflavum DSM 19573 TaxID=1121337 RepID=A0A318XN02_9FIRM|nr:polymer-forming cytoskeletal protein [Ruminiclostridium sufflavum]PYG89387.1 cytoskeletal protein CcmA (bactofilin family) [Ruminiclostridium sufflavum DSM 19573]
MFNRQTDFEKATFDTLIGSNTDLIGDINSKGIIRIDGKVTGNISVQGDLFIGEAAYIKGNVTASNIHIAGSIDGDVSSSGLLKLLSTAKLIGDIQVKTFICDEGSIFDGNCKMLENQSSKSILMGKKKEYKKSSAIDEEQSEN